MTNHIGIMLSMSPIVKVAIGQLEDLISKWESVPTERGDWGEYKSDSTLFIRIQNAILRLAPKGSAHHSASQETGELLELGHVAIALRDDFVAGYLSSIEEMIHGALFSDFLEASEHLLDQGYKDAAAVLTGGVLETHLRQLCVKFGISVSKTGKGGKPEQKKADSMNTELRAKTAYDLGTQKQVTAMLDLRNSAAHADYGAYDAARAKLFVAEVRLFVSSNPA